MAKKVNQPSPSGFVESVKAEAPVAAKKEKKKAAPVEQPSEQPTAVEVEATADVAETKTEDSDTNF